MFQRQAWVHSLGCLHEFLLKDYLGEEGKT